MARLLVLMASLSLCGCTLLPQIGHQPTLHNPFPQLSKVAVAPFFNLSNEPTVDGRQFALAYFNELQSIPGYEVVPVNVVERAIQDHQLRMAGPDDARRLAQLLGVDALVVGAITDYSPYYPPRCAMQVEWYAANPGFHPIPPGYGLPWGTRAEKDIPPSVVFQAEMALAKEQMKTQTPPCETSPPSGESAAPGGSIASSGPSAASVSAQWPDPRGFVPPPPSPKPPSCWPSTEPVMSHTETFNGNATEFTDALQEYYLFRDDARFGGWQSYLERSDDFIRFCCYLHIRDMLTARGGAGKTRVVWRWPMIR
jgi:hypothetical protein